MIINKGTKEYISNSKYPNSNWLNKENSIIVDDNSDLGNKILNNVCNEIIIEDDNVINVIIEENKKTELSVEEQLSYLTDLVLQQQEEIILLELGE